METTPNCIDATGQDAEKVYLKYFDHYYSKNGRLNKEKEKKKEEENYFNKVSASLKNAIALNNAQRAPT